MTNGSEENENGEFNGETFVFIRAFPDDDGSVPRPDSAQPWQSPDMAIIHPDGTRRTWAKGGLTHQVEIIVTNGGGIDAVDVYVEVYSDLVLPNHNPVTPDTATCLFNTFITINGYSSTAFTFPWRVPKPLFRSMYLMYARACLSFPPDCHGDSRRFNIKQDRHVALLEVKVG